MAFPQLKPTGAAKTNADIPSIAFAIAATQAPNAFAIGSEGVALGAVEADAGVGGVALHAGGIALVEAGCPEKCEAPLAGNALGEVGGVAGEAVVGAGRAVVGYQVETRKTSSAKSPIETGLAARFALSADSRA